MRLQHPTTTMPFKAASVENEYKKDPSLKPNDVKSLQEWVNLQPHLPNISELQAILFLQSCYYSNEAAKTTIDTYFTVRTLCKDIFGTLNPADASVRQALNVSIVNVLPKLTPEGYAIIYGRLIDCNPEKYIYNHQVRAFDMATMLNLNAFGTYNGVVFVMDMQGAVFGHLARLNVITMKKFLYYFQEAMPIRLKGMHFINVVPFIDKVMAIMKPFMKKELINMLHIHTDSMASFYKHVPQECLPQDFGGSCDSIAVLHEKYKQLIMDNADFFIGEEKQVVDESKRPGKPKNAGDFFGIEGTFKKLDVD